MKENDKNVAKFIEKVMSETTLDSPSSDFTSKIMAQIAVLEQRKAIEYKPLISKTAWIGIFGILMAMIGYATFWRNEPTQLSTTLNEKIASLIPNIHFSDATTYSVLMVTLMVLIQIPLLKSYFDRRFES